MTHWWDPRLYVRLEELKLLEKRAQAFTSKGLPVPQSLSDKISKVQGKLT